MSKTTRGVVGFLALCGLSLFLLNCGSTVNRSSGLLYVLIQGANDISSYSVDLTSGNLSLINSNAPTCSTASGASPVPCGLPLNILLAPSGADAFVMNRGVFTPLDLTMTPPVPQSGVVPTIYGYTVNSDGSLAVKGDLTTGATPQQGDCDLPTASPAQGVFWRCDLTVAMTRDTAGKFLFVATRGNQSVTPANSDPLASPNLPPRLYVFNTQSGSTTLSLASQLSLTRIPTGIAAINDPNSSNILVYVTSSRDLKVGENLDNTLSEYTVDASGSVVEHTNPNTGFPYTTAGTPIAVLAVQTAPIGGTSGLFVYVASATTNSVSVYQLCTTQSANCLSPDVTNFKLLPVGTPTTVGSNPVAMVTDPTKSFLYVVSENSSQVFGFRINGTQGTLTALSPANLSTGSQPVAVAMHSSGMFLFVSNNASSNISSYNLDTVSGAMSSPLTITTNNSNPAGLVSK
jgi:hypothetical protein